MQPNASLMKWCTVALYASSGLMPLTYFVTMYPLHAGPRWLVLGETIAILMVLCFGRMCQRNMKKATSEARLAFGTLFTAGLNASACLMLLLRMAVTCPEIAGGYVNAGLAIVAIACALQGGVGHAFFKAQKAEPQRPSPAA